jgi:hypothetical protein
VPVTAKFSKEFYDKLGHRVADELVDWFNNVDATYRTDLRELNELNFGRFDAKLEQRLAEFRVEVHRIQSEMRDAMSHLETRLIRWMVGIGVTGFAIMIGLLKLGGG